MIKRLKPSTLSILIFLWLLLPQSSAWATNYTLPTNMGTGPFKDCSGSGSTYTCTKDVKIDSDDKVTLSQDITVIFNKSFEISSDGKVNSSGYVFNITAKDEIKIESDDNHITGNITSTNDKVEIKGDNNTIVGDITAKDKIKIESDDNHITGNITSTNDKVEIKGDNNTIVGDITANDDIKIDGDDNKITGSITSDNDKVEIKGEDNTLVGDITAEKEIKIDGEGNNITGNITSESDKVEIKDKNNTITGDITADEEIKIDGDDIQIKGDITSTNDDIEIKGDDITITGNITADNGNGDLDISEISTVVNGICNPSHSQCTTPIDHYALTHDGQGLTCESESITITAHDANHDPVAPSNSTTITLSTSIANDGWTLKSGGGSFNAGTATYTFSGNENLAVFDLAKTTATTSPHININVTDGTSTDLDGDATEDPKLAFAEAGFLLNLDNHQSCTTANLTIKAVKLSDSGLECAPAYTGNQSVDFIFNYANPSNGTKVPSLATVDMAASTVTQNRTIFFDGTGTANLSFSYQDAGKISINVSDGATAGLTASTVTTVVSPAKLIVASSDTNADCASGDGTCSVFNAAGAPFNLDVTAACGDNTVTKNFVMSDIPLSITTVAPNVGNPVTLGVTSFDMSAADNGMHTENNQTVSEVGVFTITATPLVNGYYGETIPAATSANIGRFIPDHFDVSITHNSFEDTCTTGTSDFTYIGQPFTYLNAPELLITAKNVSGLTTQNYTEAGYQKLTSANIVRTFPVTDSSKDGTVAGTKMLVSAVTSAGNLTTPTSVPSSNTGKMTYTFDSSDSFTYSKDANSEVELFTSTYDILINSIQDSDNANASTSLTFNVPSTNTVSPTGVNLRFGRWNIDNTFGPETSDLPIPMTIQYWDGSNFLTNTLDNCTAFDGDDAANYSLTLNNLNNPLSASNITPISGSGNFALGLAELKIGKPTDGAQGQIRLTYDSTPAWLQYDWDWNGVEVKSFDEKPSAIVTFGLFRGNDRIIYMREVFN